MFSREFCEISKNTFLTELLRWLLLLIGMDQQLTAVVEITGRSSVITGQFPIWPNSLFLKFVEMTDYRRNEK